MILQRALPRRFAQRVFRQRAEDALPHVIEHKRIYILPSQRGWAFLFSLLIMLVASINYSLSLGYALCFLLTGLFWATLLHTYRNLAGLCVDHLDSEPAFCGETLDFRLRLHNPSTLARHALQVSTRQSQGIVNQIAGHESQPLVLSLLSTRRGSLALGRLTLSSDFPLGLWRTWCYLHTPASEWVYPALEMDAPALPGSPQAAEGDFKRASNQGDVAGLRDYQIGDSLTSVAWKSAARGLGLHVRTFDDEPEGSVLHLSLASTRLGDLEEQLGRLAAWVVRAEGLQLDYALELPGTSLPLAHGKAHREAALRALALYRLPE